MDQEQVFKKVIGQYDAPAYMRRANRVDAELRILLQQCGKEREKYLAIPRMLVGQLRALAGEWDRLRACLQDEEGVRVLEELHASLAPTLRAPPEVTQSRRKLRAALVELCDSLELFNQRWSAYLAEVDLAPLNKLREEYNRYYVLEKECALRSPTVARMGFTPLAPVTTADLLAEMPLLPVPMPR